MTPTTPCTFPPSMTRTRSQLSTVLRRWAMVSTVQPLKASLMVLCSRLSVLESMEAVASSSRTIWWGRDLVNVTPGRSCAWRKLYHLSCMYSFFFFLMEKG